jgi:hypothetical protein
MERQSGFPIRSLREETAGEESRYFDRSILIVLDTFVTIRPREETYHMWIMLRILGKRLLASFDELFIELSNLLTPLIK